MLMNRHLRRFILIALFVAINIVVVRFFSVSLPMVRISFGYITTALCSAVMGPWWGALNALIGDVTGTLMFPKGAYFVGYTISEVLRGIIYGLFFYKKDLKISRIILCVTTVYIIPNLLLIPLWETILSSNLNPAAYWGFFYRKLATYPILYAVQIFVLILVFKPLNKFIESSRKRL